MSFHTKLAIILAAAFLPFLLSGVLTRKWRMQDYFWKVWLVLFCVMTSAAICWVGWPPRLGIDLRGGVNLVYELAKGREAVEAKPDELAARAEEQESHVDMDQLISSISKRINPGGQKEITIRRFGPGQIEIIIPEADEEEVERIKKKISSAGTLEFRITANHRDHRTIIERATASEAMEVYSQKRAGEEARLLAWWVPVRKEREGSFESQTFVTRTVKQRGQDVMQVLVVSDRFNVTGQFLTRAATSFDEKGRPDVTFRFNSQGAQLFGQLTTLNKPDPVQDFYRMLGIILDGYLYSAPRIQSPIFDNGQISGDFTQREAQDLADVLNAGALPAALNDQPITELQTGPTLGRDTIERGRNALALALALVFVFMLVYYRFSGIIACSAVMVNIVATLAIMILIKAPLTLPGLAGLALTVGMAVDANVLIYERIREELAKQATLRMAIRNGFSRALSAIVDSNITTLISGIVLYAIGTDQIKGFAVTLTLGVAMSMFTAVFCAHVVFDVAERQKWISKLRMMRLLDKTNFDFYGMRRRCYAISIVITVVGLVAVLLRGHGLLDIDFTGGVSVQAVFNEPQDIAEIRATLSDLRDLSVSDVQSKDIPLNQGFIINTGSPPDVSADDYLKQVKRTLQERFQGKLVSNELTVSQVSAKSVEASKPGDKGSEKPGEPKGAKPAPAATSTWTDATLEFTHMINYSGLEGLIKDQLETGKFGSKYTEFRLSSAQYEEGSDERLASWQVSINLPRDQAEALLTAVEDDLRSSPHFPSSNTIGGKVAGSTRVQAIYAIVVSNVLIMVYLWIRFERLMYGVAAVVALVHDVLVALGFLAASYWLAPIFGFLMVQPFKIGLTEVAAFLTLVGFSVNDTVVIFDRIREVKGRSPYLTPQIVNQSINETLSRTVLTSLTVMLVVVVLYVLGGPTIHGFAFAMMIGVLTGTYSTVFVASPLLFLAKGATDPKKRPQRSAVPADMRPAT